ncbi:hypothetical protein L7F22_016548 [Adiantum nelumboides]|nr:hypothetical protein [Adiantum nelumboides]
MGFPVQVCAASDLPKVLIFTAIVSMSALRRSLFCWLLGSSRSEEAGNGHPLLTHLDNHPTSSNISDDQYQGDSNEPVYYAYDDTDDPFHCQSDMQALIQAGPLTHSHAFTSLHMRSHDVCLDTIYQQLQELHANIVDDGGIHEVHPEEEKGFCCVCLCPVDLFAEHSRLTGCGHKFHRPCLDSWLQACGRMKVCPLCRACT